MFVRDSWRIWKKNETGLHPANASEFWHSQSDSRVISGIEMLGLASPYLKLSVDDDRIFLDLALRTEMGILLAPREVTAAWNHCIINDWWVPFQENSYGDLWVALDASKASLGGALSKNQIFSLIRNCSKWDVDIEVPDGLESSLAFTVTSYSPARLQGKPYPYQKQGIDWLCDYLDHGLGGLLCDEMGLGKTYQAIGLAAHALDSKIGKVLVVCPSTLLANWKKEFDTFFPNSGLWIHAGQLRSLAPEDISKSNLILTTYDILYRDIELFDEFDWGLVMCDEAQALKNRRTKRYLAVSRLRAKSKFLITGTPIENSLTDLWSLVNIVYPGLLGEADNFERMVEDTPLEAQKVGRITSPLTLRRRVDEVAQDLPPLIQIDERIQPSQSFAQAYEEVRTSVLGDSQLTNFLVRQLRLTQICCYPGIYLDDYIDNHDAKFSRLAEILDELSLINRDKVLIFTTFTDSIDLLVRFISARYGPQKVRTIDGRGKVESRQETVDAFNSTLGFEVLVINPKAGGAGLNITGANHVIHFNRQWNPQLEKQATARAYRRKQEKPVFVHRFFYSGTIEEVINERLAGKEALASAALESALSADEELVRSKALLISPASYI